MTENTGKRKSTAKQKEVVQAPEPVSYVHVDEFLETAQVIYPEDMNAMTIAGFKAYVAPKVYFKDELELKEKLDTYLGK